MMMNRRHSQMAKYRNLVLVGFDSVDPGRFNNRRGSTGLPGLEDHKIKMIFILLIFFLISSPARRVSGDGREVQGSATSSREGDGWCAPSKYKYRKMAGWELKPATLQAKQPASHKLHLLSASLQLFFSPPRFFSPPFSPQQSFLPRLSFPQAQLSSRLSQGASSQSLPLWLRPLHSSAVSSTDSSFSCTPPSSPQRLSSVLSPLRFWVQKPDSSQFEDQGAQTWIIRFEKLCQNFVSGLCQIVSDGLMIKVEWLPALAPGQVSAVDAIPAQAPHWELSGWPVKLN